MTAVCVVFEVLPDAVNGFGSTAIDKRPLPGRLDVGPTGLAGDTQCDRRSHGGRDKAVYAYADEDAAWWQELLGRPVPPGSFGENLRTRGLDVSGAEIGERWRIGNGSGSLLLEITQPRIPCRTFQEWTGEPHWVRRFTDADRPGAYLRVIDGGTVAAGDGVDVVHRPGHGVTVAGAFRGATSREPGAMVRLLGAATDGTVELAPALRRYVDRVVGSR
ncbi:MAG: MOSC domain-containing protein [Actinomycetales bacterium]|nr:MOSC domain-containing protein [Actinomycetales bacterium]